jgi:pyruvate dehydrogenase E2 component (dihydrolipoamide acetyltransferase)
MADFVMPILGADMQAGKLVRWLKRPGEEVRRGDIIAEVETDKAAIEVEIFLSGVLERVLVEPGEKVPVGTVLAIIRQNGAEAPAAGPVEPSPQLIPPPAAAARAVEPPVRPRAPTGLRVSPVARNLATKLGVDLTKVVGTGPGGRIQERDVAKAATELRAPPVAPAAPAAPAAAPAPEAPADRQARMRQAIAAAMARSSREIPHFHLATTIDLRRALDWLTEENARRPVADRLLPGVLLIKAVALALREVPELNGVWAGDHVAANPEIHVGQAIVLRGGGLVAPAIHHTDRLSLDELMGAFRDLVRRARAGTLRSSELTDPTITLTSLGEQGVEAVYGLIYPPQVALVGFGKIVERPWVVEGGLFVRPLLTATLAADHRAVDGHRGSLFLTAMDHILQEPQKL